MKKRTFSPADTAAGQEFVEAYFRLTHFAEEVEAFTLAHGHTVLTAGQPAPHHPK